MTSSPIASPANIAAAEAALGGPILGNDLVTSMQQLVIAIANMSGGGGGGSGTVTSFSFTDANGISGVVANATTTPNLTLTLGNITPSRVTISTVGASGVSDLSLTGSVFTGGSATTTKPKLLIEPTGTTSTGWSTNGTLLGVNAASGFTGNLIDLQVNGARSLSVAYDGRMFAIAGVAYPQYTVDGTPGNGMRVVSDRVDFWIGASPIATINSSGIDINGFSLQWGSQITIRGGSDGTGRLVQRAGVTPQMFSVAGTYTSFTDKEEVELGFETAGGIAHLWTVKGSGGGTARSLALGVDATAKITLTTTNIMLEALPTSDPGVAGALYKDVTGLVFQSP